MGYISTRGGVASQTFEHVLLAGLAPGGGLFVPERWPTIDLKALKGKSYVDSAEIVTFPFVEGAISRAEYRKILEETYSPENFRHPDVTPLHPIPGQAKGNITVMELFHGPTIAFKDIALQLLGRLFEHVLTRRGERITIVGATSGDTGSAAIEGCKACDHADIFILHPKGRVSDVQRRQMTTVDAPNVFNIAIDGTFDDCQNLVKSMFNDQSFRDGLNLSAVNSINWARIMAQIVYYFVAAVRLGAPEKEVSFVVPSGNFGNMYAAYAAQQMGLPVKHLCVSTNRNDILDRFLATGEMKIEQAYATLSPSMDIQISSNFERYLFDLLDRDTLKLAELMKTFRDEGNFKVEDEQMIEARQQFRSSRAMDSETEDMMQKCMVSDEYVLDPHTAVGLIGARMISEETSGPVVLLATAHPAKFPDAVRKALAVTPTLPEHLAGLMEREEKAENLPNNLQQVEDFIRARSRVTSGN
ncbi:MAG: threonine synthase [Alphaproteobacteria bacterium]|nr:threonine synthase [Alphaproteobacteria bacterium]MCB9974976.1 threonine synthase [Rhodospirillales bacterium]